MNTDTYYIDPATGDDTNDGLSPERPLKTYADREFDGGDTVLFKRGSVMRNILHTRSGTEGAPITYGAYGEGGRPAFLGSVPVNDPAQWVEERPSLWRYTGALDSEVCNVIFNEGECCGCLRWRVEDLRQPGEWHYTTAGAMSAGERWSGPPPRDGRLYLCSPANPGLGYGDIECALWGRRKLAGGRRHVVLENLSFQNAGVHGYHEYHAHDVVIRDCEFRFIGGAVWNRDHRIRFGNAVEFWDGARNVTVEGCLFDNIYDAGVTHQGGERRNIPERIWFRDNLFIGCGLAAYECREPSQDVYFEYNTCIDAGGGFSMQGGAPSRRSDPYPQPVGYHVFIWMIDANTQPGPVTIRHNILCEGHGAALSAIIDPVDEHNFVLAHNSYWQTTDAPLIQFTRLTKGTTWADAQASIVSTGKLPLRAGGRSYDPSEFARYQAESGRDKHSLVARPLFVDATGGDYRQRDDSPCLGMGMRRHVRRNAARMSRGK